MAKEDYLNDKVFEELLNIAENCDKQALYEGGLDSIYNGDVVVRKWTNYPYEGSNGVDHYQIGIFYEGEVYVAEDQTYTKQADKFNEFSNWLYCPVQAYDPATVPYKFLQKPLPKSPCNYDEIDDDDVDDCTPVVLTAGDLRNIMSQLAELREKVQELESNVSYLEDNVEYRDRPWEQ